MTRQSSDWQRNPRGGGKQWERRGLDSSLSLAKALCSDRPGLTAEQDEAAAHRAQIYSSFVKQVMISQILPFAQQSTKAEDDEQKNLKWFH